MKKSAFTLAEVLITIGIVGVVAAMTMPSIINKVNEYILKQEFKRAYNIMQNAQVRIYADIESYYNCYYITNTINTTQTKQFECKTMGEHLKKIINPVIICDGDAYNKGCIPKYKGVDNVALENNPDIDLEGINRNCPGFTQDSILNKNLTWVLQDGTIISWYKYNASYGPLLFLDINGKKQPNRWGYDLFPMIWRGDEIRVWLDADGVCSYAEKGGKTSKQMLQDIWK